MPFCLCQQSLAVCNRHKCHDYVVICDGFDAGHQATSQVVVAAALRDKQAPLAMTPSAVAKCPLRQGLPVAVLDAQVDLYAYAVRSVHDADQPYKRTHRA